MKHGIDVVFFGLFFTLVTSKYNDLRNENILFRLDDKEASANEILEYET